MWKKNPPKSLHALFLICYRSLLWHLCLSDVCFRLSNTQECLESSLIEKENTLAKTSEKLELISSLRESLSEKEIQFKEVSDKLLQTEHSVRALTSFYMLQFNIQQLLILLFLFFLCSLRMFPRSAAAQRSSALRWRQKLSTSRRSWTRWRRRCDLLEHQS